MQNPIKGLLEVYGDAVQALLVLKVFRFGFEFVAHDLQHASTRVADEADLDCLP